MNVDWTRNRKPTERSSSNGARMERAEALKRSRTGYIGQLTKNYRELKTLMKSENFYDTDTVLKLKDRIVNTFDNFEKCCKEHIECLKEQCDIEDANVIYNREREAKYNIEREIDEWMKMKRNPFSYNELPVVEPFDSVSQQGSNKSTRSSTATKLKLKAMANQAVATLKLKQLIEEQDLQETIEEMTMKMKLEESIKLNKLKRKQTFLKAQHEAEQRNTEFHIYEKAERIELDKTYDDSPDFEPICRFRPEKPSPPQESTRVVNFSLPTNPFATPLTQASSNPFATMKGERFHEARQTPESKITPTIDSKAQVWLELNTPKTNPTDKDRHPRATNDSEPRKSLDNEKVFNQMMMQQERIANAMTNALMLPKPELFTFDGNSLHYWRFIRNYEQNIEAKTVDDGERLNYLLQYCTGKAREVIKNCVVLDSSDGYATARKLLQDRFGEPYTIATAYIELVTQGPPIRTTDREGLRVFADKLKDCELTLRAIGYLDDLNNAENLKKIAERFPVHLKARWLEIARAIRSRGDRPRIDHMSEFLSERAKAANDPVFGQIMDSRDSVKEKPRQRSKPFQSTPRATTLATQQAETPSASRPWHASSPPSNSTRVSTDRMSSQNVKCALCEGTHLLASCNDFKRKTRDERMKFVRDKGLCDNCFKRGHRARNCFQKKLCEVEHCEGKHHALLHPASSSSTGNQESNQNSSNNPDGAARCNVVKADNKCNAATDGKEQRICLPIVPVRVRGKRGRKSVNTYALLDKGSDTSLCEKHLLEQLGIKGEERTFSLTTIEKANVQRRGLTTSLEVMALDSDDVIEIPTVLTVDELRISTEGVPLEDDIRRWRHLDGIQLPEIDTAEVTLLIGNDTPEVFWALEERRGQRKEPYAVKSLLGWTIVGPMTESIHRHSLNAHYVASHDEELKAQVERFWKTDFGDSILTTEESMSVEDKRALSVMKESTVMSEGHYQVALPWKHGEPCNLNNRQMAESRLSTLRRRFLRDPGLYERYKDVINDYISKGYARRIFEENNNFAKKVVWYLPHHPVINPQKPDKLRVVFDCAAKWKGMSLNDLLLQGPDQTNTLIGVLTRFREEPIALASDIEAMFLQVRVDLKDCDMLRFLWWPDGDLNQQPTEFQMLVHLFGATSSPSCANFALRKTADDNRSEFDDEVVNTVYRNFYVDDCLKSTNTVENAKRIASELTKLLQRGGFRLTKWMSNNKDVLDVIPESERAKTVKKLDFERLPIERALGVEWDVEEDCLGFKTQVKERPFTRRGMLSVVSSVYDPLGIAAPFVLVAKLILQELCRQQLKWDDPIPEYNLIQWKKWLTDLPRLSNVTLPRCLRPPEFEEIATYELHHFADASQSAYGSVSYLRIVNVTGETHCSFLIGKSRLAPIKPATIPRLELSAAVVAVKVDKMLKTELDLPLSKSTFWTDSTSVLQFINSVSRRFNIFVANRVAIIHEDSSSEQWRYVNTKDNPADDASRGLTAEKMMAENGKRWLQGPEFLWKNKELWPAPILNLPEIPSEDPEVKREKQVHMTLQEGPEKPLQRIYKQYSEWYRLKVAIAWLMRFKNYIINNYLSSKHDVKPVAQGRLTVNEIREAEDTIIKDLQGQAFNNEIDILKGQHKTTADLKNSRRNRIPKASPVHKLSPVLKEGILLVGGRLENAPISDTAKHPPILPKNHHVCELIIRHYHRLYGHVGREHVLSLVKQRYWIMSARPLTRRVLKTCFDCRRRKAPPCVQRMADLPVDRLTPDKPPFSFVGTDFFGPFFVKRGRSVEKRYGCIFTCLTSRAVHLEIAHTLEADSFINALQRFINRRGKPLEIRSDNGTNFKGGERELRESIQEWNLQKIEGFLKQREIIWKFNPPGASSMGGVWERIIRSVRSVLKALLKEQTTTDETLLTLTTQVEAILNSRPLTTCSDDPTDELPLTPNHILLLRPTEASIPLGVFKKTDQYGRRRWRQCQYLANLFWKRWLREYLPTLQQRQKWIHPQRNLTEGDVVLVVDETVKRGQWPLARVLEVYQAKDGLVRSAKIKTRSTVLVRPIHKLCMLEGAV